MNPSPDTGITNNYTSYLFKYLSVGILAINNFMFRPYEIIKTYTFQEEHLGSFQRKTLTSALGDPSRISMMKSATQGKL